MDYIYNLNPDEGSAEELFDEAMDYLAWLEEQDEDGLAEG